jgi:iron complex transport system substrate-binding protein
MAALDAGGDEKARVVADERPARENQPWEALQPAGGEDIFAELATRPSVRDRTLSDPMEAARRCPDIIIGSWCGKRFRPETVAARPGWEDVPAVRNGQVHEIKSAIILAPGPAAIREGLPALANLVANWANSLEAAAGR